MQSLPYRETIYNAMVHGRAPSLCSVEVWVHHYTERTRTDPYEVYVKIKVRYKAG